MPGSFLDTNILVYSVSDDEEKANRAEEIIKAGGCISVQVLNELTNVLRRKRRKTWPQIETVLATVRDLLTVQSITVATHETGIALARRHNFSIYDSMIVAAALTSGCDTLWSEDMHDGLLIERRLRITNPFSAA